MKTIAFWNRKGGTGKTTTAGNIAGELMHYGKVLAVDADPQGNLSSWLIAEGFEKELSDVLAGDPLSVIQVRERLAILPTFAIGGGLREYAESKLPKNPFAFHSLKETAEKAGYDYLLFDLAPGDSLLETYILAISDTVVLVTSPELFGFDGIESAEATLSTVRGGLRGSFQVVLVCNRVNSSYTAHRTIEEAYREVNYPLTIIKQSTAIHDALTVKKTLYEYEPGNRNAEEYVKLGGILKNGSDQKTE